MKKLFVVLAVIAALGAFISIIDEIKFISGNDPENRIGWNLINVVFWLALFALSLYLYRREPKHKLKERNDREEE